MQHEIGNPLNNQGVKKSVRRSMRSEEPRSAKIGKQRRHELSSLLYKRKKKNDTDLVSFFFQARDGDRTRDPLLGKEVLHR